jgi:surface protein
MSNFLNKIPVSPITSFGNPSVPNGSTIGTNFSILQTGGYMEVYTLSGLTYTIPPATTGIIEFSGNSIPIQFTKGSGSAFSPDVLTLNSDNISSGRRKLGMLAYVYETNKIYQFRIDNYDTLWNSATGATGMGGPTVVISDFGTTVKNNSAAGIAFINAWTASTISGVGGYDDTNASWRVLSTGGSSGGTSITGGTFDNNTDTLTLNNSTGGTITITGFTDVFVTGGTYSDGTTTFTNNTGGTFTVSGYFTGQTDNSITGGTFNKNTETLSLFDLTGGTVTITGFTDNYTTGFTFNQGNYDLKIQRNNSLPDLTVNLGILSSDMTITGGTYDPSNGTATFTNNTGGTFNVTGFLTGFTDIYVTGGTFDKNIETLTLTRTDGGQVNVSGFTDVFVTGGTYSGGTIIFTNNSGGTFNVGGLFTGATDVFVTGGTYSAGTTTFTNNTGGTFQVTGYTKQGDYVESVTGDGVDNTDPLNPIINQNAKVNVITVTLGDLGLSEFADNETMLLLSKSYLNSLNEDIPYDTLYQLEIIEGTGITPTFLTTFVSKWNVTNSGDTIILPYEVGGTYSGGIDWGDGSQSTNSYSNRTHTYTNSGTYTIKINGVISGFNFFTGSDDNRSNISEINQWGNLDIGNNGYYFYLCSNLVLTGVTDSLTLLSGTTNLQNMFQNCTSITSINNLNDWDVSNVNNMSYMFNSCPSFNQNIGNWDVSNVTDMSRMFFVSSSGNFNNGGSPSINNWNTVSVTGMSYMFYNQNVFNQPIDGWNVSNVKSMTFMFRGTIFNQPLSGWNVSNVTDMSVMFRASLFNQPIGNWNVSKVTNMGQMFDVGSSFNQDIGNWNISGVTNFVLFMSDKTPLTFSTTNLNAIYNGWSTKNPKTGITINFGTAKYTSSGQAGKNILTGSTGSGGYGWIITDGGI